MQAKRQRLEKELSHEPNADVAFKACFEKALLEMEKIDRSSKLSVLQAIERYPQIVQVSYTVTALPPTQVSVERLFSALRLIQSDLRASMKEDLIEAILFLRSNYLQWTFYIFVILQQQHYTSFDFSCSNCFFTFPLWWFMVVWFVLCQTSKKHNKSQQECGFPCFSFSLNLKCVSRFFNRILSAAVQTSKPLHPTVTNATKHSLMEPERSWSHCLKVYSSGAGASGWMLDSSGAGAGAYAFLQWLPSPGDNCRNQHFAKKPVWKI